MAEYYHTNILLTNGNLIQEPVGEELNFHSPDLILILRTIALIGNVVI